MRDTIEIEGEIYHLSDEIAYDETGRYWRVYISELSHTTSMNTVGRVRKAVDQDYSVYATAPPLFQFMTPTGSPFLSRTTIGQLKKLSEILQKIQ